MFGFRRRRDGPDPVATLHAEVVAASRRPELYREGGLPDTMEGRFEALVLHAMVVMRRLRRLPPPAADVAQDLVDALFAHLEVALREMGVGDFGVPKRMKKLAGAFFDRTARYDPLLAAGDVDGLAAELGGRLGQEPATVRAVAALVLASEERLAGADLPAILAGPPFASILGPQPAGADR